jgi:hypothetical protein
MQVHVVLVFRILHRELTVVRAFQFFADALRQVNIGGRNFNLAVVLVDVHDPV